MTIRKGESWGGRATIEPDVVVDSDRAASEVIEQARLARGPVPRIGLIRGDLCRTLGGTGALQNEFPIDLGEALVDGRVHYFVAHVVVRDRRWRRCTVVMNAQWVGEWNLGPKAHPNDGLLDTYEAQLSLTDRWKVRQRLASGSHLPHPRIDARRTDHRPIDLNANQRVYLDGADLGPARHVLVRIQPDALRVIA